MNTAKLWPLLACALAWIPVQARSAPLLDLKPGETRIVLIGDSLVEQEQSRAEIETLLARRFPHSHVICRNLGWSGDTVRGEARTAGDHNPAAFERLLKQTSELKPDLIFVGYGGFEAFDGAPGLASFNAGYEAMLDAMKVLTPRFVLLSPCPQEDYGRPLPDPASHNKDLEAYAAAIQKIAERRGLPFVDLFHPLAAEMHKTHADPASRLTDNTIALNERGYTLLGAEVERQLGLAPDPVQIEVASNGKRTSGAAARITGVDASGGILKFQSQNERLGDGGRSGSPRLKVTGLSPGDWILAIDGKPLVTTAAAQFAEGLQLPADPDADQTEKLRQTIVELNEVYYRRWHPWNDHPRHYAYLDKDYPLYDQSIAGLDKQVAELSQPPMHTWEISPASMSDDPEAERKLLEVPPGMDIQLFASDPLLQRPVTMNFDAAGRLWVLCIPRYPQLLPGQAPTDYITVLEDRAGTGKADTAHTFVTGLRVATGMIPDNDNGVYVGEGDLLLHFKDTKGTGTADERKVIFSGFGTGDTHHTLNTFRWGNDGFLYFNQGWYINSSVETPWGPRRRFTGCIWQLRPETLRLEIYDRSISVNNTWGLIFDAWGRPVISSPWPADINLVLPETPLNREADETHDLTPPLSMTRIAGERLSGLELVSGRHFPADWQNNLVAGGFNSGRVYRYKLEDNGQRLTAAELAPLVVGHHSKFRPIDVKMGPDGALYILDWYNIIIQHNQVDFHDPRRDHTHGRIWRITFKDRPLVQRPRLADASIPDLLDRLKDPEQWTRVQAKRILNLRDHAQVAASLAGWTASLSPGDSATEHHLIEALWTYQTIDAVEPRLLARLLRASSPQARAAATTVLGYWNDRIEDPIPLLAAQANDENPGVRLSAVLAAQRIPSAQAAGAGLQALDHPTDETLRFELHKLAVVLKPYWFSAAQTDPQILGNDPSHLLFALEALPSSDAVPMLLAILKAGKAPPDRQTDLLCRVAESGTSEQESITLDEVLAPGHLPEADRTRLLDSLVKSSRVRGVNPAGDLTRVAELVKSDGALGNAAMRAVAAWKLDSARQSLEQIISDPGRSSARSAAIGALVGLGGDQTVEQLKRLTAADRPYSLRIDALSGLATVDAKVAAESAAKLFHEPLPPGADPAPAFAAFLRRSGGADLLAAAMKDLKPAPDVCKIGLRQLAGSGVAAPSLFQALSSGNATTDRKATFTPQEQQRLVQLALTQGDPARGELIFRGQIGCMQCHSIAGAGGTLAPDLAVIGTTAQPDFLVEHLIIPGKSIKDGFAAIEVVTKSDDVFTGIRVRETSSAVVLRDGTRDEIVVPKDQIKRQRSIGTLMPTGLTDGLTDGEFADLVRFLIALGKPGPFDAGHAPVARQWLTPRDLPSDFLQKDARAIGKTLQEDSRLNWSRACSNVAGELPLAEEVARPDQSVVFVRSILNVSAAGPVGLAVNRAADARLWIDGTPVEVEPTTAVNLAAGRHNVDFAIDLSKRRSPGLRCEIAEIKDSPGRAQWSR